MRAVLVLHMQCLHYSRHLLGSVKQVRCVGTSKGNIGKHCEQYQASVTPGSLDEDAI